jgi:hypothetical protein|tara:strand:+ start:59 stop:556 length:498 start_codon:yes stop_codon:yes gene_type:complete
MKTRYIILLLALCSIIGKTSFGQDGSLSKYQISVEEIQDYVLPSRLSVEDYLNVMQDETYESFIEEFKQRKPDFAGYFIRFTNGCGSSCRYSYIVDVRDGEIYGIPGKKSWEGSGNLDAIYDVNSTLYISGQDFYEYESETFNYEYHVMFWNDELKKIVGVNGEN